MTLKQLFCRHIWKDTAKEVLCKNPSICYGITNVDMAVHMECVSCGAKRVRKEFQCEGKAEDLEYPIMLGYINRSQLRNKEEDL